MKLRYRNGASIATIIDTDEIEKIKGDVAALPRLPLNGYKSAPWPFGIVYLNVSEDKKLFHIHGNVYFNSTDDTWSKMVDIPGRPSGEYGLLVPMPLGTQAKAKRLSGCGFTTTVNPITPSNMHRDDLIVGTDGNIYLWPTTTKPEGNDAFNLWVSAWYVNVDDLPDA